MSTATSTLVYGGFLVLLINAVKIQKERREQHAPEHEDEDLAKFQIQPSNVMQQCLWWRQHAVRAWEKCFREQTNKTPAVMINYLGSVTSIIQNVFPSRALLQNENGCLS